ncbi:MAG: urate hydroxylase PuuD [Nitrospira sp.]|nr:urate hydroxylase PuuD [Nitrospira sp.]MDH4236206.1 urate hydroxylase PuuD [Nitrospira sp.]MDH4327189.1 urate hydroxylase PuuD [Nitrospira sp.]MDH5251990.1 urate hydroxylase PuuD [Nitrospira sp.]MDH5624632.1 urate hydroxylase PuuD [Nitrospira sp.]
MKFLENPTQTMIAGFALTAVLIGLYLGMTGTGAGEADWFQVIIRWIHFLAGITWIGILYFFNLINAAFLKSLDGPTKNVVIPKLMPMALNWFRHGATVTVLAGVLLYGAMYHRGGTGAVAVAIGGLLGIIMMGNVHGIIWPNQKKIIAAVTAAAQGTPAPPEMAQWGRTALLASRVNFMLSIPMLFFMGAGSHFK